MSKFPIERIVVALLLVAVVVSAYILAVDNVLWTYNRGHAIGLIVFVVVDLVLIGLLFLRPKFAILLAMLWGGLQVILLVGDVVTGLGLGADPGYAFRYLFLGEGNQSGPSTAVLFVLYVLVGILSLIELLKTRRAARSLKPSG